MQSEAKQNTLKLAFGLHRGPTPAPAKLLRQFRDLQAAIEGVTEQREVDRLAAMLREAA